MLSEEFGMHLEPYRAVYLDIAKVACAWRISTHANISDQKAAIMFGGNIAEEHLRRR